MFSGPSKLPPDTLNNQTNPLVGPETPIPESLEVKMVDNQKKRKLPAALSNGAAKGNNKKRKASAAQKAAAAKPKRTIDAASLAWKDVQLPEMFDDAEGFFGLEEVTGVEVVRDGNTVKFVSTPLALPLAPVVNDPLTDRHVQRSPQLTPQKKPTGMISKDSMTSP